MSLHNLARLLEGAKLPASGKGLDVAGTGALFGWGTTVGNGTTAGWGKGCIFIDYDASGGAQIWENEGTVSTCNFKAIPSVNSANTWASLQNFASGITLPTAQTIAVSTADKITVGGVIVPQAQTLASQSFGAGTTSQLIYTMFVARDAWQVTHIDCLVDTANAAGTVCLVKAGGTTAPATSSSPMLTAAVGMTVGTSGVNTVQVGTLTTTTAHLQLTAGDRVVAILTTAMITGQACITIRGKRI